MRFEHEEMSEDRLSKKVWEFDVTENLNICLNYYAEMTRESTRKRNFTIQRQYYRLDRRCNTVDIKDVRVPDRVASTIVERVTCQLRFSQDHKGNVPLQLG